MYVYSATMQSFSYIWNVFIRRPETLFCSVSAAQILYIGNVYNIIFMASTSNRNTPGNYALEQKMNQHIDSYQTYIHAGEAYTNHLPGNGLLPASTARSQLCGNYCDVESQLRGIGSTNLVNPQTPVVPQHRTLDSLSIMTKLPVLLPEPLVVEKNQRPGFLQ